MNGVTPRRPTDGPPRPCARRGRPWLLLAALALPPAPIAASAVQVVDAEQLIALALADPTMVIVDSRLRSDREQGYIEGSISLPDVETDCRRLAAVLPSRQTPVAFYCNNPNCDRSERASRIALECGYQHSYWFRGGLDEWVGKHFPTLSD